MVKKWTSHLLQKKFKLPLIIEFRDPLGYDINRTLKWWDLFHVTLLKIERKILNSADVIIMISDALKELMIKKFPFLKNKQIYVVENGLNLKNLTIISGKNENTINFTFIGKIYGERTIEPLFYMISDLNRKGVFNKLNNF